MAVLLPVSLFGMNDENEKVVMKIPLKFEQGTKINRNLLEEPIQSYYYGLMSTIITDVINDLGDVTLTVTNLSTGEVWYDTFDSGVQSQNMTLISGTPGWYEVVYMTASGDVYSGLFEI